MERQLPRSTPCPHRVRTPCPALPPRRDLGERPRVPPVKGCAFPVRPIYFLAQDESTQVLSGLP